MDVPDQKGRLAILKVHAKNKKLAEEIDLSQIAMRTPGFSGADLANLLNEVRALACSTFCLVWHPSSHSLLQQLPPPTPDCRKSLLSSMAAAVTQVDTTEVACRTAILLLLAE